MWLSVPKISNAQGCLQANIIILLDWSGSVNGDEAIISYSAMKYASELKLSDAGIKLSIITFNDVAKVIAPLSGNASLIQAMLVKLAGFPASGGSELCPAIKVAGYEYVNDPRNVRNILIIISDGLLYDVSYSVHDINELINDINLSVYAIQINNDAFGYYNLLELVGANKNHVTQTTNNGLLETLKTLDICN